MLGDVKILKGVKVGCGVRVSLGCFSKKKTSRILQLFSSFFTTKYALVVVKNGPFFDSVLKFSKCLKKRYFTAIFSC